MSSGRKKVIANSQERAVSTDINRAQTFAAFCDNEIWRYLLNVGNGSDDLDAGGTPTEYPSTETPLRAEIVGGLLVTPAVGSFAVSVAAGMLFVLNPDAVPSPDDSSYKYVRDPGATGLAIAANTSGSIRIDVVECARAADADTVLETDNRDIFSTSTGLFTPQLVVKASEARLQYRVRQGTPGLGYPAAQAGWLPLCVVSVPDGATSNDDCTFWDVRPMVHDREFGVANLARSFPNTIRNFLRVDDSYNAGSGPGGLVANGIVEATLNGRRIGGAMRRGSPGTDADLVDLFDGANQSPGFSFPHPGLYHLYLVTPFGLPRWARYTDSSSGIRKPRSPRGIPVLSLVTPRTNGKPSSAIVLPTDTGLGSQSLDAVCVFTGAGDSALTTLNGGVVDGDRIHLCNTRESTNETSHSGSSILFTLTAGTHYPAHAKSVFVRFFLGYSVPYDHYGYIGGDFTILPAGSTMAVAGQIKAFQVSTHNDGFTSTAVLHASEVVEIPIPTSLPSLSALASFIVKLDAYFNANGITPATASFTVYGWRI